MQICQEGGPDPSQTKGRLTLIGRDKRVAHASGVRHGERTRRSGGSFISVDVMPGRGIGQSLPCPCVPTLEGLVLRVMRASL